MGTILNTDILYVSLLSIEHQKRFLTRQKFFHPFPNNEKKAFCELMT
jgi:hypothetical protein